MSVEKAVSKSVETSLQSFMLKGSHYSAQSLVTWNIEPYQYIMGSMEVLVRRSKVIPITGYVFATSNGTMILPRNLNRAFTTALKRAGIKGFRFHDLRHSFATRLVQKGIDLYKVSKLLGHKDITTSQRYSHHCPESLRDGVNILDSISARPSTLGTVEN